MSKSAHRRGDVSRAAPVPLPPLRTVRDDAPAGAVAPTEPDPETTPDEETDLAFTADTSLLALMEAILGAPVGRLRDHRAQEREVDAQIRALRDELGLPEPPPPPVSAPPTHPPRLAFDTATDPAVDAQAPAPDDGRRSTRWRSLVAGWAGATRRQHVGVLAMVALAGSLS